jgi:hypothetical protein
MVENKFVDEILSSHMRLITGCSAAGQRAFGNRCECQLGIHRGRQACGEVECALVMQMACTHTLAIACATPAGHSAWPALVACDPQRNRDALARGRHKFLQVGRVFPTEHELAAREIEGRKEMVEERSPDDSPAHRA